MPSSLESLLRHPALWRGQRGVAGGEKGLPTGFPTLDEALPGGGWPRGALVEVLSTRPGTGELGLLMPALAALAGSGSRLAWVDPPHVPYAPALAERGVDPSRLLLVRTGAGEDGLWAAEQALRSRVCGAVLLWPRAPALDSRALRRLQLAAEAGRSWGLLFRSARHAADPSPAPVRVMLEPAGAGLSVRLIKCRGHPPSAVVPIFPIAAIRKCPVGAVTVLAGT